MRIAMWSGPRNLSTALMYSFGARSDCQVWDEPYYAAYLLASGLTHPMQQEIINKWPHDPTDIARSCTGQIPTGKSLFYQKHMTHHMLPEFETDWMVELQNVFLIRHPARVLASYDQKRNSPTLEDIGFQRQLELFEMLKRSTGRTPVVIDSFDIRNNPKLILRSLCSSLNISWDPAMLSWPAGGHKDDGPWAPHWYNAVWQSTGFAGAENELPKLNASLASVCDQALPIYAELSASKLQAE